MHLILLAAWFIGVLLFFRNKRIQKSKMADIFLHSLAILFGAWLLIAPLLLLGAPDGSYWSSLASFYYTIFLSALLAIATSKFKKDILVPYAVYGPTLVHLLYLHILAMSS